MFKLIIVAGLFALASSSAMAACPTSVPGNSKEAIRANEQRVLCLQQEVDERARQRQLEMELRANQNAIQSLQLQRRFDNLPRIPAPPLFTQPTPFVPD
jgi:TolA-binding protein